jgi:hypothetical protein
MHIGVGFDGDDAAPGRHVGEVGPNPRPDLDHLPWEFGEDLVLLVPDEPVDVTVEHPEKPGVEASPHWVHFEAG